MIELSTVDEMLHRIVEGFCPLRVVLFGSCARNEAGADSDIDLLVVMPDGTDTRQATMGILSELRDAKASKDIVVTTPAALSKFQYSKNMIANIALREGRTLYERN